MKRHIEFLIFKVSRWLLLPFYLKLFYTLTRLAYYFVYTGHISNEVLMQTLEDVDITMIANLVKMIITGSYNSFVDKSHDHDSEKVNSFTLKTKMATSIVGVSSIHLLKTFIEAQDCTWETLLKQLIIHVIFIWGALKFAKIDYLHIKSEKYEKNH